VNDAYEILGIEPSSSDEQIRHRYLELVRQHPPDRDPQRFAEIRAAYDRLRDPVTRLEKLLFQVDTNDTLDAVISDVQRRLHDVRVPLDTLLALAEQR
jgi:DnaJ-domain-containing protein 1